MKADEKMVIGEEEQQNTNFEYLQAKVGVLEDALEKIVYTLEQANLGAYNVQVPIRFNIEDETYRRLLDYNDIEEEVVEEVKKEDGDN